MKRFATWYCSLSAVAATSVALGSGPPLIDPPTPPPCAADGTCYPNTCRWGYYPGRWRTWPGTELAPEPTSAAPTPAEMQRVSPELGHSETPPAELEDAAAPPSSPKHEPPAAAAEPSEKPPGSSSDGLPPGMPDVPLPDVETPTTTPLTAPPTSEVDPPPALPSALSMRSERGHSTPAGQATPPVVRKSGVSRVPSGDPPPSPPWVQSASL